MKGGNPAAGVLVLLVGLYLLLAYFAGRLEWLFSLGQAAGTARASAVFSTSTADGSVDRNTSSGSSSNPSPPAGSDGSGHGGGGSW